MLILALESSAKAASVALMQDAELLAQYSQCSGLTHSRTLLPMVEDMLKNTDKKLADVDFIAVAHGPGSFTGIRIGVSTVKGLAWASDKKCVGVSTLAAMAWHGAAAGGLVCSVMDARRSQVYNALFEIKDGAPERLCRDRAIALSELAAELKGYDREVLLVGDGARLSFDYLTAEGISCRIAPQNLLYQSAWGVGMEALRTEPGTADDLLPVYLRLSQAERERQERLSERK
ncbi:MAG: tRNA (adenosine(37)-N6)-threonylcarbamoyltransferase complex dimerization subunit type 1 TsaB [Oscillospiraceae bacterium]|nr:tRNA (adenosine(37)-N6)-threonylcarbamoyltransferase complex dimerization subunit type 1 TsaB [Oscillospiraceae bacterium]